MTKYPPCLVLLMSFLPCNAVSQPDSLSSTLNAVYLEILGPGGYGSVNYERTFFNESPFQASCRAGLGTYHLMDFTRDFNPDVIIPMAVTGFYGNKHKLELGLGQVLSSHVESGALPDQTERVTGISGHLILGYRYQKPGGGLVLRCSYTPILEFYVYFRQWGSISIGYAF